VGGGIVDGGCGDLARCMEGKKYRPNERQQSGRGEFQNES